MRNSLVQIEALCRTKGKNDKLDIIRRNSNNDEFCRFLYYAGKEKNFGVCVKKL